MTNARHRMNLWNGRHQVEWSCGVIMYREPSLVVYARQRGCEHKQGKVRMHEYV